VGSCKVGAAVPGGAEAAICYANGVSALDATNGLTGDETIDVKAPDGTPCYTASKTSADIGLYTITADGKTIATVRFLAGTLLVTCDGSSTELPASRPGYCISPWETNSCVIGGCP
jgi:hypothetical protein